MMNHYIFEAFKTVQDGVTSVGFVTSVETKVKIVSVKFRVAKKTKGNSLPITLEAIEGVAVASALASLGI